jgi:hypothetical protein
MRCKLFLYSLLDGLTMEYIKIKSNAYINEYSWIDISQNKSLFDTSERAKEEALRIFDNQP